MASLVQPSHALPAVDLRRSSSLIRRPSSVRFPLRCNAADPFKFDGGNSAGFHLLSGESVPASALLSGTRLEDAIYKNNTRLRIFSGTANPALAQEISCYLGPEVLIHFLNKTQKLSKPDKNKSTILFFLFETSNARNKKDMIELALTLYLLLSFKCVNSVNSPPTREQFQSCLSTNPSSSILKNPKNLTNHTSDSRILTDFSESSSPNSSFLNLNFTSLKPILILKPKSESEIKSAILCSRKLGVQVRTLSGGHDYEGLSYLSQSPFIIIDLVNLRSININLTEETAWIQSGATLGELYYKIAKTSKIHAFAAGICPSVGVGGHISGGGFGTIMRKHGLASDNVVDARLMDVNGIIRDRKAMGEDLFWALRGGGAASFGVVLSWKVKLVRVPEKVTCFISQHPMGASMNKLVHRWQYIGAELNKDLFIRVIIDNNLEGNQRRVKTTFQALFLGGIDRLIPMMNQKFPELGLRAQDCSEMSWVESIMFFNWKSGQPLETMLDRDQRYEDLYFKAKSDFVQKPVPEKVFEEVTKRFLEKDTPLMILEPLGGKISEISETESPYPHRRGNLYNIQYMVKWKVNEVEEMNKHVRWMRMLYDYMSPYVSASPRGAYLNYRDLDLGMNKGINTSFEDARKWGERYFRGNLKKLGLVKRKIDPTNFFRNEQSIPPLF